MPTKPLDAVFGAEVVRRCHALTPESKAAWGVLQYDQLVPHLIGTMRYSMGELPELGFSGNWFTTSILPKLVFAFNMSPPRNIKTYSKDRAPVEAISSPGDCDTLQSVIDRFLEGCRTRSFTPGYHPLFGNLGYGGWSKFHVIHFSHHLRQFQL